VSGANPSHPSTSSATGKSSERSIAVKVKDAIVSASKAIVSFLAKRPGVLWFYLTHPKEFKDKLIEIKEAAKKEARHYWMGTKVSFYIKFIFNECAH